MTQEHSLAEVDDTRNSCINLSRESAFILDKPDESVGRKQSEDGDDGRLPSIPRHKVDGAIANDLHSQS